MALEADIGFTDQDRVFYDTDQLLVFTVYQGNPTQAQINASQAIPEDVSGYALAFVLRKKPSSADPPLIYKDNTASPSDIAVTGVYNVDPEINTQQVEVFLRDTDTYDPDGSPVVIIKPGTYAYALKRLDEDAETIYRYGKLKLTQAAAWEAE